MRGKCYAVLTTTILTVIAAATGHATAATNRVDTLPDMTVTSTRDERSTQSTPYYLDLIGDEALRHREAPRTIPEALRHQTGTLVQKTGHGQGSPYVRGFTGFRNLLLIDGIRLNNSVFRDGPNQYWNTVDALSLNRIEFVRAPSSVLYGSDAVGGTLNAITRGVADLRPDSRWDRRLYYRYSSAEDSHIGRAESIGHLTDRLALSLGYTFKAFGDLEGGRDIGRQEKTAYEEWDVDAKLEYFANEDALWVLAHQTVDLDDAWRTHKTIYGTDWEGLSIGKEIRRALDQDRHLTYLQFHRHNLDTFCQEVHAGVSHHLQSEKRDRLRSGDRWDQQGFDVNTLGAFLSLKSETRVGDLVYGTEFYHDDVDSFTYKMAPDGSVESRSIQGPVGDDATYDTLGVFLQDEFAASDQLSFILGARYEYAAADANSVENPDAGDRMSISDDWSRVVGSARALYALNSDRSCNLFAGLSQGFRAPNLSDLTRLDSARTDEIETPSPGLDPENFLSCELGLKTHTTRVTAQVAYFYTDIRDMIVRTPTGRIIEEEHEVTKRNAGDGYVHGIEVQTDIRVHWDCTVFGAFTWMDGEVETFPTSDPVVVTEPIDRLMPPSGRFGLRWDNTRCWAEVSCSIASDADKLSTRDASDTSRIPPGGTPGYAICDLRAGWRINHDLSVGAALENVTDEDYRVHGSGINEPGRNLVVTAEWAF